MLNEKEYNMMILLLNRLQLNEIKTIARLARSLSKAISKRQEEKRIEAIDY